MTTSYIYVIGNESKPYKIGFSKTPDKRLKNLQTGYPKKISVLYKQSISSDEVKNIEKEIHKILSYKKVNGEWFDIELEEAITEIKYAVIKYSKD